jgi:hypothetical protein
MESTIVTVNQLINLTTISANCDPELLYPFLLISQQLYLEPVLGAALYNDIINKFDNSQLTGSPETTLYEEYIIPAIAYGSLYAAMPFIAFKLQRTGISTMSTDVLTPADSDQLTMLMTKAENLKAYYLNRLEHYLIDNQTTFTLYRRNPVKQSNGGSIYLGYKRRHIRENFWDIDFSNINIFH